MQNQQVDLMTVVVVGAVVVVVVVDVMVVMTEEVEGMMTGAEGKLKNLFLLSKKVKGEFMTTSTLSIITLREVICSIFQLCYLV